MEHKCDRRMHLIGSEVWFDSSHTISALSINVAMTDLVRISDVELPKWLCVGEFSAFGSPQGVFQAYIK
jgi:hypothetical protein